MLISRISRPSDTMGVSQVPPWVLRLGVFIPFALAWQILASATTNRLIPTFAETVVAFWTITVIDRSVWGPLWLSNQAMLIGFGISAVLAVPWGLVTGRIDRADRISNPYIAIALAVPIAPLIPVAIIALGLGLATVAFVVVLFAFVFIAVNVRTGVRSTDPLLVEMAESFGASESDVWRQIVLPSALPAIFLGLRVGLGRAFSGMVIVELLLIATGIGRLIVVYTDRLQAAELFAVITLVVLEALALISLMKYLQRRIAPWSVLD